MSTYPFWSLNFDLRADVPDHVMRILEAVAADLRPDSADLRRLPSAVSHYLSDWRRLLVGEIEPFVGSPVRLFRRWNVDLGAEADGLSVEFCQHDDEYADGGWQFWVWVMSLVHRPTSGHIRAKSMIGVHGMYRGDSEAPEIYFVYHEGIEAGSQQLSFSAIDEIVAEMLPDETQE